MTDAYSVKRFDSLELSKKMVVACYALTSALPSEENTVLTHYIRRAALAAHISIAQGVFLKKKKRRKKFLRSAGNSLVVVDAAVGVLIETGLANAGAADEVQRLSSACYRRLLRLKKEK